MKPLMYIIVAIIARVNQTRVNQTRAMTASTDICKSYFTLKVRGQPQVIGLGLATGQQGHHNLQPGGQAGGRAAK